MPTKSKRPKKEANEPDREDAPEWLIVALMELAEQQFTPESEETEEDQEFSLGFI
jgi:hypothetical protein